MATFLLLIVLDGCGSAKNLQKATLSVEQFHSQLNSQQYHEIYSTADQGLQKVTSEQDFVTFLQAVHKKLGNAQTSQRSNFRVGVSTAQGTVVTLVYTTRFDQGSGTEQFLWHMDGNQPLLLGYHINSNDLILK